MSFTSVRVAGAVLAASALLVGCFDQSAAQLVESGKERMQKKEYKAASIEFKNALQKDGSMVEARFLLGKALLETGDVSGAWVEFSKVRETGYNADELVPPMAAALILQGQTEKFLSEYADVELKSPKSQAELKAALATVYGSKGKYVQARAAADAALQADPTNIVAQLAVARLLMLSGDKADAFAKIEESLKAHPESGHPWMARAEALQASGADMAEIMTAYQESLKRDPSNLQAHIGAFNLLWRQHDTAGMERQLKELRKALPTSPYVHFFSAGLALENRDLKAARDSAQQLLRVMPDSPSFLQLAGTIEYERGAYQQAAAHFGKALNNTPSPITVRTLLARSFLRAGDSRKALAILQPLLDAKTPPPAAVYSVAAGAYLQVGDATNAKKMYEALHKLDPTDSQGRTALALVDLDEGKTERAMSELRAVAASDQGVQAEVVMLMTYLRANQLDQAYKVVQELERKQPSQPIAPYFKARIEMMQGQLGKAREDLELAVKRSASYLPAVSSLAELDRQAGKPELAVARYEKLVAAEPKSVEALMGLISARVFAGAKSDDTRAQLEAAVSQFPEAETLQLALADHLMGRREYKQVSQLVKGWLVRSPENPKLHEVQGLAESAAGEYNQAVQSFLRAAAFQPNSIAPLMRVVDVHLLRGDSPAAIGQLKKVLAMKPGYAPAAAAMATLLLRIGKSDEAVMLAKEQQSLSPADPMGWVMEGDIFFSKGMRPAAISSYRTALSKKPVSEVAIKLHRVLRDASQAADADKLAKEWLANRPADPIFNFYLGDAALESREFDKAESYYRKVLEVRPNDAAALNNVAWLLNRAGKAEAMQFADRALLAAPNSPALMDTAAEIHAAAGRIDKALGLQLRAVEIDPKQATHRLHLAQYLIKANKKSEARAELEQLRQLGNGFAAQEEVQKMLSTL